MEVSSLTQHDRAMVVPAPRSLRVALLCCAAAIAAGTAGAYVIFGPALVPAWHHISTFFFRAEDALWLAVIAVLLISFAVARFATTPVPGLAAILRRPRTAAAILAMVVLGCGIIGAHLVFHEYDLVTDEVMADFDATIFRAGMMVAPVSPQWQPYAEALEPRFMLPLPGYRDFVSNYLPGNAALRAVVGLVADPAWTSPLLAALAVLAVFGVARRLWPERPDAALVSVLLLATSSQVLVTSMTSFAMTAHLALNLVWLWLFLRDDKIGHTAAIGVGFVAAGLHQLIFHPLFAAPFILRLWTAKRRRLAVVYTLAYAVICLFWIEYPHLVLQSQGLTRPSLGNLGAVYFIVRVWALVRHFNWAGPGLMLKNILRFIAWQNPLLLPLGFAAYRAIWKDQGIGRELFAGILLILIAVFFVMPGQGLGWGYRYLHGFIGSCALLAGYGWIALSARATREEMNGLWRMFAVAGVVASLVLLPVHAKDAHDFVRPYARAYQAISTAPTDLVFIDSGRPFSEDLARNGPFLNTWPKIMDLTHLTKTDVVKLCKHYSISVFGPSQAAAFGIQWDNRYNRGDDVRERLRAQMARLQCGKELPIPASGRYGANERTIVRADGRQTSL